MASKEEVAGIGACVIIFLILLPFLRLFQDMRKAEEQEAAAAGSHRPRSDEEEAGEEGQQQLPAAAAEQAAGPPLVCRYRRADGWRETSCGVCLSELADGEVIRVLPPCMHYFHAACVGEWLSRHATCPLCRAPLAAAGDDTT
ncbi:unnamed protein product [Urochloa humidicola]